MKNHSGRRSFLRFATSKRNRIISLCILPLVLLLSFLGSGRTVYASSLSDWSGISGSVDWSRFNRISFTPTGINPADASNTYSTYSSGYFDIYVYYVFTLHLNDFSQDKAYDVRVAQKVDITLNGVNYGTCGALTFVESSNYGTSEHFQFYPWNSTLNNSTLFEGTLNWYSRSDLVGTNGDYPLGCMLHFKVDWHMTQSYLTSYPQLSLSFGQNNAFVTGQCRYSDAYIAAHNSSNEISAINAAASQAHSDAADIIDDINYDHSGTSQSVSATQSAYDAAQGAADTAVDAAVHNYTSDLSTVEAYDYSSFFSSQRNSAVFWRDVGEYILDSSNLGFVSGSIIIVTLIGLVIFMLRL